MVIDGYTVGSTQSSPASLPLGTALVLVCRVSGIPQTQIKYSWTCPDGPCERPGYVGRKVVNGNILAVNITSDSDGGTYTCDVSRNEADGGYSQNYTLLVASMVILSTKTVEVQFRVYTAKLFNTNCINTHHDMYVGMWDMLFSYRKMSICNR